MPNIEIDRSSFSSLLAPTVHHGISYFGIWSNYEQTSVELPKGIHRKQKKLLQSLLKEIRLKAGLRQEDLAKKLNRPQSYVSKYEMGEKRLDVLELRAVCNACALSITKFTRLLEIRIKDP